MHTFCSSLWMRNTLFEHFRVVSFEKKRQRAAGEKIISTLKMVI
jgi:hypothetical protein